MAYNSSIAVIGCAINAPISKADRSLEELLYEVTQRALADSGLKIADVDGLVVGSNDQFDGRAISVMAASGSVGGVDRDILSTPSAGEHAFIMGALRIASGQYRTQVIVSWSPTEVSSLSEAERLAADPYFHRVLPLDDLSSHALQAAALGAGVPSAHELAMSIVAKNRRHGARAYPGVSLPSGEPAAIAASPVTRWPLRRDMVAPPVTGAVALVLASGAYVRERRNAKAAFVHGMGWATEASFLGDRDLSRAPALEAAAQRGYAEAGIGDPQKAFDLAEVADATPYQELLAYEGLGLSRRDRWRSDVSAGAFDHGGGLPVNPSGGALTINPVFCTGLIRIAEAANQIRGRAGPHQVAGAKRALAHAASGFAMQYQSVVVLGSDERV
jgi:acetyl-CoA C-acetyltransferase